MLHSVIFARYDSSWHSDPEHALLPHVPPLHIRAVDFAVLGAGPWISERFPVQPSVCVVHGNAETLADVMSLSLMRGRFVLALRSRSRDAKNWSVSITAAHLAS